MHDIARADDHSTFFQLDMQSMPSSCPSRTGQTPLLQLKVAPDQVTQPSRLGSAGWKRKPVRTPTRLIRFHDRDFETLQSLFRAHSLIECEEEGQIAYVDTWFVHHFQHPRCADPRAVKLFQDPAFMD